MTKNKRQLLVFSALVALLFYAGSVYMTDHQKVMDELGIFTLPQLMLVFGLSLFNYGIRFFRWQGYLTKSGYKIPIKTGLMCYIAGFAFTTTPGKAGEAIRSVYLKQHQVDYRHSLATLVTERVLDAFAILILAGLLFFWLEDMSWGAYLTAFVTVGILAMLSTDSIMNRVHTLFGVRSNTGEKKLLHHFMTMIQHSLLLMRRRQLIIGLVLGVIAWGAEGLGFYYILHFLGFDIDISVAIGIYAASMLAGAISFIPGGLGSAEAVMGGLLILAGATLPVAIAATLVCRVATLWFAVVLGIVFMLFMERKQPI